MNRPAPAALILSATLCALLLVPGCAPGGNKAGARQPVVFWQFFPSEQIGSVLDEFRSANRDLDVRMEQLTWDSGQEKITAAVAAGTVPDLCDLGSTWFPRFAQQGALLDITDSTASLRDRFTHWDLAEAGGRTYGLPWVVGTRALFWNKALFARARVDTSRAPETWDELLTACRKVNALGGGVAGYGVNAGERYVLFKKFMPYAWGNGGTILAPDLKSSTFDSPENVRALELYLALAKVGLVDRQSQLDEAFLEGKLGAEISGAWLFRKIPQQAPDLAYGVALVPKPAANRGSHASFAGGELLVSFRASKNPSGAWRLARFLASKDAALVLSRANQSVFPAAVGALDDAYYASRPRERVLLEQLVTAVPTPNHPDWLDMEGAIEDAVEGALYRKATAAQAIHAAYEKIDAIARKAAGSAGTAAAAGAK